MSSQLTFELSKKFRDSLIVKNLPPYKLSNYSGPTNYETTQSDKTVIDSENNLNIKYPKSLETLNSFGPDSGTFLSNVYTIGPNLPPPLNPGQGEYSANKGDIFVPKFPKDLEILNPYGPNNGGFVSNIYSISPKVAPPLSPNQGEYTATKADISDENVGPLKLFEVINAYKPNNGYLSNVYDFGSSLTIKNKYPIGYDVQQPPYNYLKYTPESILLSSSPSGVSKDSYLAQLGAFELHKLFVERVNVNIEKETNFSNVDSIGSPFDVANILSGNQSLINLNWSITVPESPILAAAEFALRLSGAYVPFSPIPGSYFNENTKGGKQTSQTSKALDVTNNLTGGLLGPILNLRRNPSEIFLANTSMGQKSALFFNLNYNRYQPAYYKDFAQQIIGSVANLFSANSVETDGGYYVGNKINDPGYVDSPANLTPVTPFGLQTAGPVFGPTNLGVLYEGNINQIKFGFATKSINEGGSISGNLVWTSRKTNNAAGYKAKPGGDLGSKDGEYISISNQIESDKSTNINFKHSSILDNTQRLVSSADNATGLNKLQHVGTAINQLSKVFHDGYKEMTKGSKVVSYKDLSGSVAGMEYCRIFTKDTPYYTYADLQKSDGITTYGRRFSYSVLDNTYNLNIAPIRGDKSTNIIKTDKGRGVKKYMLSIENLAWRTSSRPGYTYDELPDCEKGPNGGRIMWFPPYNLKYSDSSTPSFNPTTFLGRPEPIYTYKDTTRSGTLSFTILVDSPSITNLLIDKELKGDNTKVDSILNSFFAGCVKYDLYELAKKYNMLSINDIYTLQEILNNPRLTPEEQAGVLRDIPKDNTPTQGGGAGTTQNGGGTATQNEPAVDFSDVNNKAMFYFENDYPNPNSNQTTTEVSFDSIYQQYISTKNKDTYKTKSSQIDFVDKSNENVDQFFLNVIEPNYKLLSDTLIPKLFDAVNDKKNTIVIEFNGSASAPATVNYNTNLSKRRIDCIKDYLTKTTVSGKNLEKFITDKKIEFKEIASGETGTIPQGESGSSGKQVSCTKDIEINKSGLTTTQIKNITKLAQVYSTDAMACRRVSLKITAKPPEIKAEVKQPDKKPDVVPVEPQRENVKPQKPSPTVDVKKKLKDGISKKILRKLLTECDYFDYIEQNSPMVYDSIKTSLKYFNPAFHSMTPEGLNARLTFLNQCARPGETIPIIDKDKGGQSVSDSINSAFGAPPILVLRVGDFYHTKIVPTSISFAYDKSPLDMNPEGIGVQPMMVNVSLQFHIIGGMGLKGPVDELQNALSFNYYANTEMYDERATWTEDTSALDKDIVDSIIKAEESKNINNVQPQTNNGGNPLGEIKTTVPGNPETGEIFYLKIMDSIIDLSKTYTTTVVDQLEQLTKLYNYGIMRLVSINRKYSDGFLGSTQISLYGKPNEEYLKNIQKLFDQNMTIISNGDTNPIIKGMIDKGFKADDNTITVLKNNLNNYVKSMTSSFSNEISKVIQTLSLEQQNLILVIDKITIVSKQFDGKIVDGLTPVVYTTTPTGDVSKKSNKPPIPTDTKIELDQDISALVKYYTDLSTELNKEVLKIESFTKDALTFTPISKKIDKGDTSDIQFYMIMRDVFTDKTKLEALKTSLLETPVVEKKEKKFARKLDDVLDDIAKRYKDEYEDELKLFEKYKKSEGYKSFTTGIEAKLYPKGKTRLFNFQTGSSIGNENQKTDIKNLYSANNSGDANFFNNKRKLT